MKQLIVHRIMENAASYAKFTFVKQAGSQYNVQDAKLQVGKTGLHQFQAHRVEMFRFWSRQFWGVNCYAQNVNINISSCLNCNKHLRFSLKKLLMFVHKLSSFSIKKKLEDEHRE